MSTWRLLPNSQLNVNFVFMQKREDRLSIALGLVQMKPADLARALNVTPQHIHNWRTRGVSAEMLLQTAKVLNVRPEWLGHYDDGPIKPEKATYHAVKTVPATAISDALPKQADDDLLRMRRNAIKQLIDQMDADELEAVQVEHEKIKRLRQAWAERDAKEAQRK